MHFTDLLLFSILAFYCFSFMFFLLSLLLSNSPMSLSCVCQLIINGDDDDDDDDDNNDGGTVLFLCTVLAF